jgi:hypothetical protein
MMKKALNAKRHLQENRNCGIRVDFKGIADIQVFQNINRIMTGDQKLHLTCDFSSEEGNIVIFTIRPE